MPHLIRCDVLETAADRSWQVIAHVVNYSWYLPRASYSFRADYVPDRSVRFRHVDGDFRENEGVWELSPEGDGAATLLTYRVRLVPRFFVPQWLVRRSLQKDLPATLGALRTRCEALTRSP